MTASPGEIEQTLWPWQADDFEAKSLFPLLKRQLRAWFVQPCLCNQWSRQTRQPAILPAFFLLAATNNIPWRVQSSLFVFGLVVVCCTPSHYVRSPLGVESPAAFEAVIRLCLRLLPLAAPAPAGEMIETESHHRLTIPEGKFLCSWTSQSSCAGIPHCWRWWYRVRER
jgi:hypothetical protein